MKRALFAVLMVGCLYAEAQTTPPAAVMMVSSNGLPPFAPLTTASGLFAINFTPTLSFVPMCSSTGLPPFSQCTFGGGLGTVTSVAGDGLVDSSTPITTAGALTPLTQAANTVFGNFTGSTAAPTFSASPTFSAANLTNFPTFNQNTSGTAANITATSNSTLTTLSSLSLPGTQVTGTVPAATTATTAGSLTGTLSANQLLGSLTAVAPTGQLVPSCTGAANALQWTSGTGFGCNSSITANTATSAAQVNTNTFPAAAGFTSGGIPYYSSTTAEASSALLTNHGLLVGGGAGAAPAALAVGGANFPLVGQASANPAFSTVAYPSSCTQGGLLYGSTSTAISCGSLLTQYGVILAGASGSSPVSTAQGGSNFPLIGQGAANPVFSTIAYPTSLTSGGFLYASSTTGFGSSALLTTNVIPKSGGAGSAPVATSITDDGKNITTTEVMVAGNKSFVTSDFTDSTSTSLQLITGLSFTLPTSKAVNVSYHCQLFYDQATAAVSDTFGIGITGTAPSNATGAGTVYTNTAASTNGTLVGLASTTPTAVVTFTPSAITTVWSATLDGTVEQPSNATPGVFSIYVSTTTGTDNIIVKRGSYCTLF